MIHHSPLVQIRIQQPFTSSRSLEYSYRREAYLPGAWKCFASRVDMLLNFVSEELQLPLHNGHSILPGANLFKAICGIHPAHISRLRAAPEREIPEVWLYRLHEFSGIPLWELFLLGGHIQLHPHINARKESSSCHP